jgi:hypothetical protein
VQGAPPPPAIDRCLFCGYRRACAPSSATVSSALLSAARDTLQCALSLPAAPSSYSPEPRHHRPVEPLRLRRRFATPALLLEVSNLHVPLIWSLLPCLARDCSPELLRAAVSPPRRVQRPLVLPHRHEGHGRVRQTALNAPELVPKPLEPRHGQSPRLRRALATGLSGTTAPKSAPDH